MVTRKLRPGLERSVARADVRGLAKGRVFDPFSALAEIAWSVEDRFGVAWWDALIIAAAQSQGCRYLLTEDLQHGQRFGELEVVNPFVVEPPTAS